MSKFTIFSLFRATALLFLLLFLGACASPAARLDAVAERQNFNRSVLKTSRFDHVTYRNFGSAPVTTLHVYLEGDGLPWLFRYWTMRDPTPRASLMLPLMAQDPQAAVYVGRPCYNGLSEAAGCSAAKWTSGRYGPDIVASMRDAIAMVIDQSAAQRVRLFGHSGGGALAMLVAESLPETTAVVTLAGNLNITAWTDLHDYTPLYTSLNPVGRPPLPSRVRQLHLTGENDSNIPPVLVSDWIARQRNAEGIVLRDFTHNCCWKSLWPRVLRAVQSGDTSLITGKRIP